MLPGIFTLKIWARVFFGQLFANFSYSLIAHKLSRGQNSLSSLELSTTVAN